ncbi:MAG TPA: hypothetical protein VGK25_13420 [Ignavibacteria bacterium]|jgi:hypothetical protein
MAPLLVIKLYLLIVANISSDFKFINRFILTIASNYYSVVNLTNFRKTIVSKGFEGIIINKNPPAGGARGLC